MILWEDLQFRRPNAEFSLQIMLVRKSWTNE